jgi:hypothetical protein
MNLHEYGIITEQSDIRAHVGVANKTIYAFKTRSGVEAIETHKPQTAFASQPGVNHATAEGWLVKPTMISGLQRLKYLSWAHWGAFTESMTTSQKGDHAVKCVLDCLSIGRFPLWVNGSESNDRGVQIAGTDIVLTMNHRIQVKCDWYAGEKPLGTGNLFLQKAECNPFSRH